MSEIRYYFDQEFEDNQDKEVYSEEVENHIEQFKLLKTVEKLQVIKLIKKHL